MRFKSLFSQRLSNRGSLFEHASTVAAPKAEAKGYGKGVGRDIGFAFEAKDSSGVYRVVTRCTSA